MAPRVLPSNHLCAFDRVTHLTCVHGLWCAPVLPQVLWVPLAISLSPLLLWLLPTHPCSECWAHDATQWQFVSWFHSTHFLILSRISPPHTPGMGLAAGSPCSSPPGIVTRRVSHNNTQQCLPQSLAHLVSLVSSFAAFPLPEE